MDTNITPIHESESEIEITLTPEEYAADFEKAYQKQLKKVNVPGFRKGKVPKNVVEKMFGNALKYDAAEEVANSKFFDYVEANKINVYDRPKMTDFKYEPDANLVYKVKYEHQPTLNLTQYKGLEV
ncbi:MAG: trigger factor family protein, partial [Ignavibacteriales bacterium]|nr:trigger factor family protein [Ignavibacteriales bacterium]